MSARPVVDRLERDLGERARVVRLDVARPVGREVMDAYQARLVPVFLVFDGQGELLLRQSGRFPNVAAITAAVEEAG